MRLVSAQMAIAMALLAAGPAPGQDHGVAPGTIEGRPGGPAASPLQVLIDRAHPGDRIEVEPGSYHGDLLIDKTLTLVGRGRPRLTGSGQGSVIHLATELFDSMAAIKMNHIPYKGTGPALTDTISGQTNIFFSSTANAMPHVKSGRLRAVAVTTAKRIPALPEVPTVAESGLPGYEVTLWHGLVGPKGLPRAIVDRLNTEVSRSLKLKETAEQLQNDGVAPAGGTPEQFAAQIKKEIGVWRKVVADAGVKAE